MVPSSQQAWSVPVQLDPPGWQWETAGTNGMRGHAPTYTMRSDDGVPGYFNGPFFQSSAGLLHGPFPDAARTRLPCDPQCQVDQYGRR